MIDVIHRNPPTEKIIHYFDCTWCKHRLSHKKALEKKFELEQCNLDKHVLPSPKVAGRFCESFQKVDCPCPRCNTYVPIGTNS